MTRPRGATTQTVRSQRVYASSRLVGQYDGRELNAGEEAVLAVIGPALVGRRVLELGCGAGAVTQRLLAATDDVVGLDVSPAMVEHCRATFTTGTFVVGDLRDLTIFAPGEFGAVVAAANVLDILEHEERDGVFAEIRRLTATGGLFYFSAHNRRSTDAVRMAARGPRPAFDVNPYRLLRGLAGYAVGTMNHRRLARYTRLSADYAILNDDAHRWSLLHHYITRAAQERELEGAGFTLGEVWAIDGRTLSADQDDSESSELHYVARAV